MKYFHKLNIYVCIALTIATLVVFGQVKNFEFVNYDDTGFIVESPLVQSGITPDSVVSAFKKDWGYWKPLTCLSLMLDRELYGMNAGGFHVTNLILHIASTLLLFLFFRMVTGALWQSVFVAALFALHPLHVESVAWVTERKDVLSAFFWMLSMVGYVHYLRKPGPARYMLTLVSMALGLMAKPVLVTLPFALLLLDFWPLGRLNPETKKLPGKAKNVSQVNRNKPGKGQKATGINRLPYRTKRDVAADIPRIVREKIPMMMLVAVSILIVLFSYSKVDTDIGKSVSPALGYRISNSLVSYAGYVKKMFLPIQLAIPYPHRTIQWQETGIALVVLLGITFAAVITIKSRPYIAVGWFWYLGTLVPVLGLVEFGSFAMADRFTYIPMIGLFIIIAWGVPDLLSKWRRRRSFLSASGAVILLILMALSWKQAGYWENTITLFEHAIDVTSDNYVAHNNLGIALKKKGCVDEAIEHYSEVLRIKPDHARAHNNLGITLKMRGELDNAVAHFETALRIVPDLEEAHNNLGIVLKKQGRINEAIGHYHEALRIRPDYKEANNNLGVALYAKGDIDGAIEQFQKALQTNPDYASAKKNLKKVLARSGRGAF